jgi:hypothetical protein
MVDQGPNETPHNLSFQIEKIPSKAQQPQDFPISLLASCELPPEKSNKTPAEAWI